MAVNEPGEKALAEQIFAARDLSTPERAAASIRAWRDMLALVGSIAEVRVMEALAVIRRHVPERHRFDAFCAEHLDGVLRPDDAWNQALTWEVSGRQRALREFAHAAPTEATAFVRDLAAALPVKIDQLDEDDRELAELLAAPPRTRRLRLRELVATKRAVTSASTAPGELHLVSPSPADAPPPRAGAVLAALDRSVRAQTAAVTQIRELCVAPGALSASARSRMLLLIDVGFDALEQASSALHGHVTDGEDG